MYTQIEISKENKGRAIANTVVQKKSYVKQSFGFVDNRPEANLQRKLKSMVDNYSAQQQPIQKGANIIESPNNSSSGTETKSGIPLNDAKMQSAVKQLVPESGEVCQLEEKDVRVTGVTRLVAPGTNLQDGTYTKTVNNNDPVTIERTDTLPSNRGPNNEIAYQGPPRGPYKWYRATKVRGVDDTDKSYILDETFVYEDKSVHLTDDDVNVDLRGEITTQGKGDIYARAHGIGSASQITTAQKAYQAWLQTETEYSDAQIMDLHRSVGFEYEFATYATAKGESPGLDEHIKLGESEQISSVFGLPFVLETDEGDELEAITPPFLIADGEDAINKDAANRIYQTYRNSLKALRDGSPPGTLLTDLDFTDAGLGDGWVFTAAMTPLYTGGRAKHSASPDHIYSQMNISLTAEEIAEFTAIRSGVSSNSYRDVKDANAAILADFQAVAIADLFLGLGLAAVGTKVKVDNATANICKGLAGLVTIPSILAHNEGIGQTTAVFSSVKEYCGVWLKDSIPNIVDNTLDDASSRTAMLTVIDRAKTGAKARLENIVDIQLATIKEGVKATYIWPFYKDSKADTKLAGYKTIFQNEYDTTIAAVKTRLSVPTPQIINTPATPDYGEESFGDAGLGVRKDTFVNIQSGASRNLHLAEFRNDYVNDMFLGVKRRQRETNSVGNDSEN